MLFFKGQEDKNSEHFMTTDFQFVFDAFVCIAKYLITNISMITVHDN